LRFTAAYAVNIHTPYASLAASTNNLAKSAEELKLERQRLSRMIDTAIDGIITVDDKQEIILVNPAALIFGYEVNELVGTSLNRLIPARHRETHKSHVQQFGEAGITRRKMGTHFEDFYVTGCRASGEEFRSRHQLHINWKTENATTRSSSETLLTEKSQKRKWQSIMSNSASSQQHYNRSVKRSVSTSRANYMTIWVSCSLHLGWIYHYCNGICHFWTEINPRSTAWIS
jgi:PAS domain S-box-containing protein